jgi:hypothetical protein
MAATYSTIAIATNTGSEVQSKISTSSTSGVPFISQGTGTAPTFGTAVVAGGGTGLTTQNAYAVLCGGTTGTAACQSLPSLGSSGNVLTSNGASALPSWQAAPSTSISITGDTGGALTGTSFTFTGGTSGLVFAGSGTTFTESFNYLNMLDTTATTGQVKLGGTSFLSSGNGVGNGSTYVGAAGNFTNTGFSNTGIGYLSLNALTAASNNHGFGQQTLDQLLTGGNNIAIGFESGHNYTGAESSNILMNSLGTASESNALRIGAGTGTGTRQLNKAFICGIQTIVVTGTPVLVSSGDQLGVAASSIQFKENVVNMADTSALIASLRPVNFNWKKNAFASASSYTEDMQYGLIAEEVAKEFPYLCVYDKKGAPFSVKYHELPAILLNELQKALKRIEVLESKLGV